MRFRCGYSWPAGWLIATTAGLETPFAVGIMLVAACPGGTASNVVTYIARAFGYDRSVSRTISIEVGLQNSGLGVVLAQRHFPAEPLTAVPCAISSVVHSVLGSLLAGCWRMRP